MNIYWIAALVTILAGLVSFYDRISGDMFSTERIPISLQQDAAAIELRTDLPEYKKERSWLLEMYEVAKSVPYSSKRAAALRDVVRAALKEGDFNLAILAAVESPYPSESADLLQEIVSAALQSPTNMRHAVLAANKIPYPSKKSEALAQIVSAYSGN